MIVYSYPSDPILSTDPYIFFFINSKNCRKLTFHQILFVLGHTHVSKVNCVSLKSCCALLLMRKCIVLTKIEQLKIQIRNFKTTSGKNPIDIFLNNNSFIIFYNWLEIENKAFEI